MDDFRGTKEHILNSSASTFMEYFFDSSVEAIMITDLDGVILEINSAFSIITGYEKEESLGRTPKFLQSGRHDMDFYEDMWQRLNTIGKWAGEIWNRRKNGEVYPEWLVIRGIVDDRDNKVGYMAYFYDLSSERDPEGRFKSYNFFDFLTGLPNREMFIEQLSDRIRALADEKMKMVIVCLNIDSFRQVNESLGYSKGDELLIKVAQRLHESISSIDNICRFSGDSFYMILSNKNSIMDIFKGLRAIEEVFSRPFIVGDQSFFLSATKGISVFPDDGRDVDSLLKKGEKALYKAKETKRGSYLFFSYRLEKSGSDKLKLASGLREAIVNDEICMFLQPQVDLRSGDIIGFEALARWCDPVRGVVPPKAFIPLAEETGLIKDIDFIIFDKACRWSKRMERELGHPVVVSVNISPRSLFRVGIISHVKKALSDYEILPENIHFEITETVAMDNLERGLDLFEKFKNMGISLYLDDFGSGYSSLNYLHRFPIESLKIDQSFMSDLLSEEGSTLPIIKSVIALGHSLGVKVLAEGVEDLQQIELLKRLGCDWVQGFYYSKPLSEDKAREFLLNFRK